MNTYGPAFGGPEGFNLTAFLPTSGLAVDLLVDFRGSTAPSPDLMLYETRTALPPLHELIPLIEGTWSRRILNSNGKYHQTFECELANSLNGPYLELVA